MGDIAVAATIDRSDGFQPKAHMAAAGFTGWAAALMPPAVVLALPIMEILGANFGYFWDDLFNSVKYFLLATVFYAVVGVFLFVQNQHGKVQFLYHIYLLTAPAWIILRVAKMVLPTGAVSLLIAVGVTTVLAFLVRRQSIEKIQNAVVLLGTIVVFGFSFEMMWYDFSHSESQLVNEATESPLRDDLPNIYHIMMDEFQTDLFTANLDDRVRNALSGFTLYPEATASFGRTELALAGIVSGREYQFDISLRDYLLKSYREGAISNLLRRHGYRTSGRILKGYRRYEFEKQFDEAYIQNWTTISSMVKDGPNLLASLWMKRELPDFLAAKFIAPHHYAQLKSDRLTSDLDPVRSLISFRDFMAAEASKAGHGRYEFHHLIIPHHPTVLSSRCAYEFGRRTTSVQHAGCAVLLIEEFVATLKKLGRYEDSVILIHADHGQWMYYRDGNLVSSGPCCKSANWNWGRSRPLVLFKPAGAGIGHDQLAVSSRPVVLQDLLPTVLDSVGLPRPDGLTGQSMLAADFPDRPERIYNMYDMVRRTSVLIPEEFQRYIISENGFTLDADFVLPSIDP